MISYRRLKEEELPKWFEFCASVFTEPASYFERHFLNDPWSMAEGILIAVDEEHIVSTVRVFHRNIYVNGQSIPMGGIGEVCTLPRYEKKGISSKLLELAIEYMKEQGFRVSTLLTDLFSHYGKLGWKSVRRTWNIAKVSGFEHREFYARPIDFTSRQDIDTLMNIYEVYSSRCNGPIIRDHPTYWSKWIAYEAAKQTGAWMIMDCLQKPIGYVVYNITEEHLQINEFACIPGKEDIFDIAVAAMISSYGKQDMSVKYPDHIISSFPTEETYTNEVYMIKNLMDEDEPECIELHAKVLDLFQAPHLFWSLDGF